MTCEIISIGDELLIGDTVNTNASWMGNFLTEHGIEVTRVHTVGDQLSVVVSLLRESLQRADLVITTGGLGPTHDDITKKAVQQVFDVDMVIHEQTLEFIKKIFKKRNIPFSKSNYYQAEVPAGAEVLFNKQGTAPGLWMEKNGHRLVVLPGVPYEMKNLMEEMVLPRIKEYTGERDKRYSRYILTAGVGESTLSDEVVGELDDFLNDHISIAYLPSPQGARIRISGYGTSREEVDRFMEPVVSHIYSRAEEVIVGEGKEFTLSEALGSLLREQGRTLAVAESCTGGHLANTITDISGCSDYFLGEMVTYTNNSKAALIDVSEEDLKSQGAVSLPVALQMSRGVAAKFGADIGISTTGIAGPSGGSRDKPVGTVWIGYWSNEEHFALKALFTNDRLINKERTTAVALETVRRRLLGIERMPYDLKPHFA